MYFSFHRLIVIAVTIATPAVVIGQTSLPSALALSSGSTVAGQTVELSLALNSGSGNPPAAVQWTLVYPSDSVDAVSLGNSSAVPGKSPTCSGGVGTFSCIVTGPNQVGIPNGLVATILVTVSRRATSPINIGMTTALGASPNADPVPIASTGGIVSVISAPVSGPSVGLFACAPNDIPAGAQTSCTVTLQGPAPADTSVYILSSSSLLGIPAVVVVPAGGTKTTFSGVAGTTASIQMVTLSAVLNGTVVRTGVTVEPANPIPSVSSLSPNNGVAGSGSFILSVNGSNFVGSSVVLWNNSPRPTTFVTPNVLTASIGAGDIAAAGAALITVSTPGPGGGISGGLPFTISGPAPLVSQVQNGASFMPGPVAPGSFVAITGSNLADQEMQSDLSPLPTVISNVSVSVNNIPTPLKGINPNQINAQLPWNLLPSGAASGTAELVLTNSTGTSAPVKVQLSSVAPGVFYALTDATGVQRPAAVNGVDGSLPLPANVTYPGYTSRPATIGDPAGITLFATGLGPVNNQPANGAPGLAVPPYSTTLQTPTVLVGGVPAQVAFSGLSPEFPGVYQINVVVQPGTPTGNALPVQIQLNGFTTTDQLKIAVSN